MSEPDRITAVTKVSDHVAAGIALLAEQFRGKAGIEALAAAWLAQAQAVEDALWALLAQAGLAGAADARLDQIGALLLVPRGGLDDATYRAVLRAAVRARKSSDTPEDVIDVARLALGATSFAYAEGAAAILIEPHAPLAVEAAALIAILRLAKGGGVQIELVDPPRVEADLFTFAPGGVPTTDAARGFGDEAGATGGYLTGVLV